MGCRRNAGWFWNALPACTGNYGPSCFDRARLERANSVFQPAAVQWWLAAVREHVAGCCQRYSAGWVKAEGGSGCAWRLALSAAEQGRWILSVGRGNSLASLCVGVGCLPRQRRGQLHNIGQSVRPLLLDLREHSFRTNGLQRPLMRRLLLLLLRLLRLCRRLLARPHSRESGQRWYGACRAAARKVPVAV